MQLRPYQAAAIDAIWSYLRAHDGQPCAVLPTGAGKTPVLVALSRQAVEEWGGRVLILAHVKELLSQAVEKFQQWWPMAPVGVYSAGLKSRDTVDQIIVAGIQSVHKRAALLGRFDIVIVDEAHLIPADGEGMYRRFLANLRVINPKMRVIGLTATPYRLDCGTICGPDNVLTDVCYEANVRDLIDQKFLSKLRGKAGTEADVAGVHTRGGDFIQSERDDSLADDEKVKQACDEIMSFCGDRRAWVVFCAGAKHAEMVRAELVSRSVSCAVITGETPTGERDASIASFKAGGLRALININVLSLGFDAPHVDAVVMLRPTQSPGLYYQQVGRGLRLAPGKTDCLVLDLAGNVRRHGPIDRVAETVEKRAKGEEPGEAPTKTCPTCREIIGLAALTCPACGHEFPPPPIAKHATKADTAQPISGPTEEQTWDITGISYEVWNKRGAGPDAPKTVCVTYRCGLMRSVREWICVEHTGFARAKAALWWQKRSLALMPDRAVDAVAVIIDPKTPWREPTRLVVKIGGKFPEIARALFEAPCSACRHFDGGHCHQWGKDVPSEYQSKGCDSHAPVPVGSEAPTQEEAPF